jgi:hypothetical protein
MGGWADGDPRVLLSPPLETNRGMSGATIRLSGHPPIRLLHLLWLTGSQLGMPLTAGAQTTALERVVTGQTIESKRDPVARLRFAAPFRYAGGQRLVLHGSAEAEQHFFVDADRNGVIRRLFWIQFERRLSDTGAPYQYALEDTVLVGDLQFIADTKVFANYGETVLHPDSVEESDQARAGWFLRSKGLQPPAAAIRARMFHLPDRMARSELMIIYVEGLSQTDTHGRNLPEESGGHAEWPELAARVIRDAQRDLAITRQDIP